MSILKGSLGSNLGLKGNTPERRAGASIASQLHVQVVQRKSLNPADSKLDLDRNKPDKTYSNSSAPKIVLYSSECLKKPLDFIPKII